VPKQVDSLLSIADYFASRWPEMSKAGVHAALEDDLEEIGVWDDEPQEAIEHAVSAYMRLAQYLHICLPRDRLENFGDAVDARMSMLRQEFAIRPLIMSKEQLDAIKNQPKDITDVANSDETEGGL